MCRVIQQPALFTLHSIWLGEGGFKMREETQLISFFEISFFLPNKTILHAKFQTHRSENIGTGHTIDGQTILFLILGL